MSAPKYCVMCGSRLPDDQGSNTCSMCYGDIDHGRDGYYRDWAERQREDDPTPPSTDGGKG